MDFRKFGFFMLALGMTAAWARGSNTYQITQTSFTNQATVTDGLTVSSVLTFTGMLTELMGSGVSNDEYIDPTTGIEFLAFNSSGTTHESFAAISGNRLNTTAGLGDSIEVIFPSGADDGLAFNFTTSGSFETLCVDTSTSTFGDCASGGTTITSGNSGFIGTLNDNPSPAALVSLWIHPQGGTAGTDLQSFDVATPAETPEAATLVLIGGGLVLIYRLRRRQKSHGARPRRAADRFA